MASVDEASDTFIPAAPRWRWNPFADSTPSYLLGKSETEEPHMSISALVTRYQQKVRALERDHDGIMLFKGWLENLCRSIAPEESRHEIPEVFVEDLMLLKHGLDIRVLKFDENCRQVSKLEWLLQNRLDTMADTQTQEQFKLQDPRQAQITFHALKQIQDQDRLIKLLQHELDRNLIRNMMFEEQLRKLRKEYSIEVDEQDSPWLSASAIHFKVEGSVQYVGNWMQMLRMNPTEKPSRPQPQLPEKAASWASQLKELGKLKNKLAEKGLSFERPLKGKRDTAEDTIENLIQLRNVLSGLTTIAQDLKARALQKITKEALPAVAAHRSRTLSEMQGPAEPRPRRMVRSFDASPTVGYGGARDDAQEGGRIDQPFMKPNGDQSDGEHLSIQMFEQADSRRISEAGMKEHEKTKLRKEFSLNMPVRQLSRTLPSPRHQGVRSQLSRTLSSPKGTSSPRAPASLTRAMSSAFLGG